MKIALLGYGKMGKAIEAIALERGHDIVLRVAGDLISNISSKDIEEADVAIEFSVPEAAPENIQKCFKAGVPVVVGTTGWYAHYPSLKEICLKSDNALLTATNFSIGVNIFFAINKKLALLMDQHTQYDIAVEEIHHTEKKDAPSGTAITIAEDILSTITRKTKWENTKSKQNDILPIISKRTENVPGTHTVTYSSEIDNIEIKHEAHSRKGFALGAVLAAEWLQDKKGVFGMEDVLQINNTK